jgi:hypothetical protein
MTLLNIPKFRYKPKEFKKSEKLFAIGTENLQIINICNWVRTYIYILKTNNL